MQSVEAPVSKPGKLYRSAGRSESRVIVVLPAYNEEANIGKLLDRIDSAMQEWGLTYEVIVVDDGSRDRTHKVLTEYSDRVPLTISRHTVNQGLGITIRDGLKLASELASDRDIVVSMDADETHNPGLIFRMVQLIREGHDVVIASRYQPGGRVYGLTLLRTLFSYVASWLFRIVFPTAGVKDYTCGFRAYRAAVLKNAFKRYGDSFVEFAGFQCMADILLKLRAMNIIFAEVPMVLRYDLKEGASKMRVARTIGNTLVLLARRRFGH